MILGFSLNGYVNDSLAYFDARGIEPRNTNYSGTDFCRYKDYRQPPCSLNLHDSAGDCSNEYEMQHRWWTILSFRLTFVLVFELTVLSIKAGFAWLIPDVPKQITVQLQRERYLARQAILQRSDVQLGQRRAPFREPTDGTDSCRSNDQPAIAYQRGQEVPLAGDQPVNPPSPPETHQNKLSASEIESFRRLYANRPRPSQAGVLGGEGGAPLSAPAVLVEAGMEPAGGGEGTPPRKSSGWNLARLLPAFMSGRSQRSSGRSNRSTAFELKQPAVGSMGGRHHSPSSSADSFHSASGEVNVKNGGSRYPNNNK